MCINKRCWLFLIYALILLSLSVCKSFAIFTPYIMSLEKLAGGDKWLHFWLAMPLPLLLLWATALCKTGLVKRLVFSFLFLSLAILSDEILQFWLSHRHFDWLDSLYGIGGIVSGSLIYLILLRLKY